MHIVCGTIVVLEKVILCLLVLYQVSSPALLNHELEVLHVALVAVREVDVQFLVADENVTDSLAVEVQFASFHFSKEAHILEIVDSESDVVVDDLLVSFLFLVHRILVEIWVENGLILHEEVCFGVESVFHIFIRH
jgi:hypothetical protein